MANTLKSAMKKTKTEELQASEDTLRSLLLQSHEGDNDAYRAFLVTLTGHIRRFLLRRLPDFPDDIEDIAQEILISIHHARHTYRTEEPLTPWLHAICRFKLVDFLRRRSRREALHDPLDEDSELFGMRSNDSIDARQDVSRLLGSLPDNQRLPLIHVKLLGFSIAETAELIGLTEPAVKIGVHRGLRKLGLGVRMMAV